MLSAWVVLVFFTLLWLLSIILLLALEAEGTLTSEVTDTIPNVPLDVNAVVDHYLYGCTVSGNTPE